MRTSTANGKATKNIKNKYLPLRLVSANGNRGCAEMLFPTAVECTFEALEWALEWRKDCDLQGTQEKEE